MAAAGNIHAFQRDTDDTLARIKEALLIIDTQDKGKDLNDVQGLLKKVDGVTEVMAGIEKRINVHLSGRKDHL